MNTLLQRDLRTRAGASLLLMFAGAVLFAFNAQDSWLALTGLLASLGGIALLYRMIRIGREQIGGQARGSGPPATLMQGCAFTLLRAALISTLAVSFGAWSWFAGNDMNEIRALLTAPRIAQAQVIGREIVPEKAAIGYVHYAYRVSPTLAPEDRFAVPRAEYARYSTGQPLEVTYVRAAPRIHRVGLVTWELALRRAVYWLLLLANGAAYLFLPLWLLRFRLRALPRKHAV